MYLYHYFDKSTGPFRNLSDLSIEEARAVLEKIRRERPKCQSASRDEKYLERRREYEKIAGDFFVGIGGKPERSSPHFMTVEHSEWLYSWYENPAYVKIPVEEFDLMTLSFTYGDMHPTFSPIVTDGKEYRKKLYLYDGILKIIEKYGLPQDVKPAVREIGQPYYVEVQVWSDRTISRYKDERYWEEF